MSSSNDTEESKKAAAFESIKYVQDGMVLGLGTGSTVKYAIKALGQRIKEENLDIVAVPTSEDTQKKALDQGIDIQCLDTCSEVDLCIDGADEVDNNFNLIKGGGGALTREKIVASAARKFIVIVDESKLVAKIGDFPVAIEYLSFAERFVEKEISDLGGRPEKRRDFNTDNGNLIFDSKFSINDPCSLERKLNMIPGVLENGVFAFRKPEVVIVGKENEIDTFTHGR